MLHRDQRGFVLSGIALLLVLPAMLLSASLLTIAGTGGEATSLQALSDKVVYTGHDIERIIGYMSRNGLPINDNTLKELADNYQAATGLLVEVESTGLYPLWENVRDTGAIHWAGTKYCHITDFAPGVWYYNFEDLDENKGETPDWDFNEPRLLVESLDGTLRITVEEYDGSYHADIWYADQLLWERVGGIDDNHVGENTVVGVELQLRIDVRDPRGAAHYEKNIWPT